MGGLRVPGLFAQSQASAVERSNIFNHQDNVSGTFKASFVPFSPKQEGTSHTSMVQEPRVPPREAEAGAPLPRVDPLWPGRGRGISGPHWPLPHRAAQSRHLRCGLDVNFQVRSSSHLPKPKSTPTCHLARSAPPPAPFSFPSSCPASVTLPGSAPCPREPVRRPSEGAKNGGLPNVDREAARARHLGKEQGRLS